MKAYDMSTRVTITVQLVCKESNVHLTLYYNSLKSVQRLRRKYETYISYFKY